MTEPTTDPTPAAPTSDGGTGMTVAQAEASLAALRADQKWVSALFDGNVAARADFDRLTTVIAGVSTLEQARSDGAHDASFYARLNGLSTSELQSAVADLAALGFNATAIDQVIRGDKWTPEQVEEAQRQLTDMTSDKEFVKALLAGDMAARRRLTAANAVIAAGVKEAGK